MLTRTTHPLGDVISVEGETAVLQSYFRNNVLHLFTRRGLDRAVLPEQPPDVAQRPAAPGPDDLPVHPGRAVPAVDRRRIRRAPRRAPSTCSSREGLLSAVSDDEAGIPVARPRPDRRGVPPARDRAQPAAGVRALLHRHHHPGQERPAHAQRRRAGKPVPSRRAAPVAAVRAGGAGVLRQIAVPRLHRQAARAEAGLAVAGTASSISTSGSNAWEKDAQARAQPRTAAHHHQDLAGSGQQSPPAKPDAKTVRRRGRESAGSPGRRSCP